MTVIRYKAANESYKSDIQHCLWFIVDERRGIERYFLQCNYNHTVRSMAERPYMATNGIYGTDVILYDISKPNLEKFAKILKTVFENNREEIIRLCREYRSQFPDTPSLVLNDSFVGWWNE